MSDKKVSEEVLVELQEIQRKFENALLHYGELHLKKRILDADIQKTEEHFNEIETRRIEIGDRLQNEFQSTGTVNLTTGEFVPN